MDGKIFEDGSYILSVVYGHQKLTIDVVEDSSQFKKVLLLEIVLIAMNLPIGRVKKEEGMRPAESGFELAPCCALGIFLSFEGQK